MLKLGTKFSSIQEQLLQQERKERVTTLAAGRNKQVFPSWNNTSLTFRAALNSSQSPYKQEEIAEKLCVCVCVCVSVSIVSLSFFLSVWFSLSLNCLSFFLSVWCSFSLCLSYFVCLLFLSSEALNLLLSSLVLLLCVCLFFCLNISVLFSLFYSFFSSPWGLGFCNSFWLPTSPSTLTHAVSTNLNIKTNFRFFMDFRFYFFVAKATSFFLCLLACC